MFVLWLLVNGEDLNTIKTVSLAAASLYSYVHFPNSWGVFCLCNTAEVKNVVLPLGVGAAFRKDLHEVCKAESTTEVSFLPSQSIRRSVSQAIVLSVRKGQTSLSLLKP